MENILDQLIDFFEGSGLTAIRMNDPAPHLNVQLPLDAKNRQRRALVHIEEAALSPAAPFYFVHFYLPLPFEVRLEAVGETARMISFFNKSLLSPGFVLDESSKVVFFRYAWMLPKENLQPALFAAMIGMITLWLDTFSDSIEEAAQGKAMAAILEEKIRDLVP
ncbi:MAG: YbjN domain-containing protein [Parachlamydia sp.]|jgi:hypothetical protein|nr:YbjN domain-containing protein [Parachlamydia sp.]